MPEFQEAPDLQEIARQLAEKVENVEHVEVDQVLFLRELETTPKALARCYKFGDHPILHFTDKPFAIVVYQSNVDYMSHEQMVMLILHEMMHIPMLGDKMIDHDVKDFRTLLGVNLDWAEPGVEVPKILEG